MADNLTLGTGLSTYPDLFGADGRMRFVSGRRLLAESLARRFETLLGQMYWDRDAGFLLRAFVSSTFSSRTRLAVEVGAAAEAEKDERVFSASASASFDASARRLTLKLSMVDATGPFELVITATPTSVDVLKIE